MADSGDKTAMLSVRLDQAFVEDVRRYTALHGLSMSQLIREALLTRMRTPSQRLEDNTTEGGPLPLATQALVTRLQAVLTETARELGRLLTEPPPVTRTTEPVYDSHTPTAPIPVYDSMTADEVPPYDLRRFYLGKLCKGGHAYGETGQTLRLRGDRTCPQCHRAQGRERRQRLAHEKVESTDDTPRRAAMETPTPPYTSHESIGRIIGPTRGNVR